MCKDEVFTVDEKKKSFKKERCSKCRGASIIDNEQAFQQRFIVEVPALMPAKCCNAIHDMSAVTHIVSGFQLEYTPEHCILMSLFFSEQRTEKNTAARGKESCACAC